jgi:HK97 family phage prohead protease
VKTPKNPPVQTRTAMLGVSHVAEHELRFIDETELRFTEATADTPPQLSGYAAKFDVMSHPITTSRGKFREKIQQGAFRAALASGDNVVFRAEHGINGQLALADTATKTLRLSEDATGLRFEADMDPTDPDVLAMLPKVKRGTLRSMSFAFRVAKGGDAWERRDGELHRTIASIDTLKDVSPVTFPAYPETDLALRSLVQFEANETGHTGTEGRAAGALAAAVTTEMGAAARAFIDAAWNASWSISACGDVCAYCYAAGRAASVAVQAAASVMADYAVGNAEAEDAISALGSAIAICAVARATFASCPDGYTACSDAAQSCTVIEKSAADAVAVIQPAAAATNEPRRTARRTRTRKNRRRRSLAPSRVRRSRKRRCDAGGSRYSTTPIRSRPAPSNKRSNKE